MSQIYAVIDIGSNSTRLMLAEAARQKKGFSVLEKRLIGTRLGEGMGVSRVLSDAGMQRTLNALDNFLAIAKNVKADEVFVFATSAVRDARNRNDFLSRCHSRLDIEVDVLSGVEEARIAFWGVQGEGGTGRLIDIGGGSTELIAAREGEMRLTGSVDMGCVRAAGRLEDTSVGHTALRQLFRNSPAHMREAAHKKGEYAKSTKTAKYLLAKMRKEPGQVYAVGGTVTSVAALAAGLTVHYDARLVQGRVLTHNEIRSILHELGPMPADCRAQIPLLKERADVICFGISILLTCMDDMEINSVVTSDADNLEGYLRKKFAESGLTSRRNVI